MGLGGIIKFLGAAGTVTGSKTLISYKNKNILIDCGLFQGPNEIRSLNWQPFPYVDKIDAVILTHAHIDHSGFLPRLVREGFNGPIYCSKGTSRLCQILLPDAGRLQEEDAQYANRSRHSRHSPALPLFDEKDARRALSLFRVLETDKWIDIFKDIHIQLIRSGHILGSTFVQLSLPRSDQNQIITFSGDIGNDRSFIIKGPKRIYESDTLILESTYGDRRQPRGDIKNAMAHIINKVISRDGTLVIPAFSVGRTQEIIYIVDQLEEEGLIPKVPLYVDSPMALNATNLYMEFSNDLKIDISENQVKTPLSSKDFRPVNTVEDSKSLCFSEEPKIVVSAAGMISGGRVLHHLRSKLPDSKNGVLFVGYQATGTKGYLLKNEIPEITIHHKIIPVKAEIFVVEGLSAHGDCEDIMEWLSHFKRFPKKIYLNHGEENAARSLRYMILSHFDTEVIIPKLNDSFEII